MIVDRLRAGGLTSRQVRAAAYISGALSLGSWIRSGSLDQSQRGDAEYRAVFIGLWVPTLWVVSRTLRLEEDRRPRWWRLIRGR